jgi:small subunit ribosomal protein S8
MSDPIADFITRIRNGAAARHESVPAPASKVKEAMAEVLKQEGYIKDYETYTDGPRRYIRVHLAYRDGREPVISGLRRISKPGLRVYVGRGEIPRVYGGLGIALISTPRGVMTGRDAWRQHLGGEVLCYVW